VRVYEDRLVIELEVLAEHLQRPLAVAAEARHA
jgi:hypothetical protein